MHQEVVHTKEDLYNHILPHSQILSSLNLLDMVYHLNNIDLIRHPLHHEILQDILLVDET
jgi:hypothetical protein